MSITMYLTPQNTFTTYSFHANSSYRLYAIPLSCLLITEKSPSTITITVTTTTSTTTSKRWDSMVVYADDKHGGAPPPAAPAPPSSTWKNWVIGFLMTFIVPFFTTKGGPIKAFMLKVDHIVDTAEQISDVVEAVADKVDDVAEKLSDDMPEGNKIKKTLDFIEQVAERVEKDAHTAGDFIDKVQELQEKIEDILEPVYYEAKEVEEEAKHKEISKHK